MAKKADKQASAIALKPGVSLDRPASTANSTARPEKGLIRSSRFIRVLVSCFIASYPFLIPPYVSARVTARARADGSVYQPILQVCSARCYVAR